MILDIVPDGTGHIGRDGAMEQWSVPVLVVVTELLEGHVRAALD